MGELDYLMYLILGGPHPSSLADLDNAASTGKTLGGMQGMEPAQGTPLIPVPRSVPGSDVVWDKK
jgi:hypothetical protein